MTHIAYLQRRLYTFLPLAPAPKLAIEDDALVAVAGDSLYCRDAAF